MNLTTTTFINILIMFFGVVILTQIYLMSSFSLMHVTLMVLLYMVDVLHRKKLIYGDQLEQRF